MEADKLKPCPFCGSSDVIKKKFTTSPDTYILCQFCGAGAKGSSDEKAIQNWNHRSNVSQQVANVNAVQQCEKCLSKNIIYRIIVTVKGEIWIKAICQECGWDKFLPHLENLKRRQNSTLRHWREHVLKRDGGKCVICGSRERLEAHHIIPVFCDPNRKYMYDVNNGITLCREHHQFVHNNQRFIKEVNNV